MKRLTQPKLIIPLLACFLFVSGAFAGQAVEHTFDHSHHKSTTHSNPLCAWMCAAGQVLQGFDFGIFGVFSELFLIETRNHSFVASVLAWSPPLRGPPTSFFIF